MSMNPRWDPRERVLENDVESAKTFVLLLGCLRSGNDGGSGAFRQSVDLIDR
jgi:hypothetical protein